MSSLSWSEVFAYHRTRKGIGKRSLLVDRGESGYRNVFLPDGRILYQGEGKRGNQEPVGGIFACFWPRKEAPRLGSSSGSGPASGGTWGATGWKGTGTAFSLRRVDGCTGLPLPLVNAKKAFKG